MSDTLDPIFKDSSTKSIKMYSGEPLNAIFHPSLLLSIGDLLAFSKALVPNPPPLPVQGTAFQYEGVAVPDQPATLASAIKRPASLGSELPPAAAAPTGFVPLPPMNSASEKNVPPSLSDQMALSTTVTARVPRRRVSCLPFVSRQHDHL